MERHYRILFVVIISGTACKQQAPKTATVTFGQVIDRTGSNATPSWADSIRLAVGTANQALKQAGRSELRFEVAEESSGNAPEMARAAALRLKQQGVKALITDSSQDAIAINMLEYDGDPAHALEMPVVCMACTTPASNDPYGRGFADSLKKDVLELAPRASVEQIFHDVKAVPGEYNWAADVKKLIDKHNENTGKNDGVPDTVVTISFAKFEIKFTKAYIESGTKVRLLHTHNFRAQRVLEALPGLLEGHEGTSQAVLGEGNSGRVFSDDLKALTGQPPAFRDSSAYDAAMSLMLATLQAMKRHNLDDAEQVTGAMIRDAMRAINDKNGEPVEAGIAGFARAVQFIRAGKAIDYQGASGA